MEAWKTHSRRVVFDQAPWLKVEYHEVELPGGRVISDWAWIQTPDYINVVVETESGKFLCFWQRKYAVDQPMLALVGGYIEPGETPLETAQRELREETGCISEDWTSLGNYIVDPNRGCATGHLFLARGARKLHAMVSDDLEEQQVIYLDREQLKAALLQGEFKVLAWAAAVSIALQRLN